MKSVFQTSRLNVFVTFGISISFSVHIVFFLRNKTMFFEYFVMSKPIHTNCNAHPDHPHRRCALLFSQQSRSVRSCRPENRGIGSRAEVTSDDHQDIFHCQDIIMVIVHMKTCDERNDQLISPIFGQKMGLGGGVGGYCFVYPSRRRILPLTEKIIH